jgi:hypothetical protein
MNDDATSSRHRRRSTLSLTLSLMVLALLVKSGYAS